MDNKTDLLEISRLIQGLKSRLTSAEPEEKSERVTAKSSLKGIPFKKELRALKVGSLQGLNAEIERLSSEIEGLNKKFKRFAHATSGADPDLEQDINAAKRSMITDIRFLESRRDKMQALASKIKAARRG